MLLTTCAPDAHCATCSAAEVVVPSDNPERSGKTGLVASITILPVRLPRLSITCRVTPQGVETSSTSPDLAASAIVVAVPDPAFCSSSRDAGNWDRARRRLRCAVARPTPAESSADVAGAMAGGQGCRSFGQRKMQPSLGVSVRDSPTNRPGVGVGRDHCIAVIDSSHTELQHESVNAARLQRTYQLRDGLYPDCRHNQTEPDIIRSSLRSSAIGRSAGPARVRVGGRYWKPAFRLARRTIVAFPLSTG
jgi:hypothetical protein